MLVRSKSTIQVGSSFYFQNCLRANQVRLIINITTLSLSRTTNILLLDIGEQLVVARDYNNLKDEMEENNDEIKVLKEELKSVKGLITFHANRLVITSSPIIDKATNSRSGPKP